MLAVGRGAADNNTYMQPKLVVARAAAGAQRLSVPHAATVLLWAMFSVFGLLVVRCVPEQSVERT